MAVGTFCWCSAILFLLSTCSGESSEEQLQQFLQPDNADELSALNDGRADNVSCTRECVEGAPPRICYYRFTLEQYSALNVGCGGCPDNVTDCFNPGCVTIDGIERVILTTNRRLPGPGIQVCEGDRIIVDVRNSMPAKETTIHWHGIHFNGQQYMDGTPMVTQCPILTEQTFRYDFTLDQSGTFFWHSHDGFQKMDGLAGSLIVREPKSRDVSGHLYDYDLPNHVMMVMDWYHVDADTHFPGLLTHDRSQDAQAYLMNGRGRNTVTSNGSKYPLSIFRVSQGKKYRFRIIGALCTECPVRIKIEEHQMIVIATDGKPIEPMLVDSLVLEAGIRFDVVIHGNQKKGSYWIRMQGLAQCSWFDVQQLSILQYEEAPTLEPNSEPAFLPYLPESPELNAENATCGPGQHGICIHQLTGQAPLPAKLLKKNPDVRLLYKFDMHYFTHEELFSLKHFYKFQQPNVHARQLSGEINNISSTMPPSPLLSQDQDVPPEEFCPMSANGSSYCLQHNCHCVHLTRIPLGAVVEMVLVDQSRARSLNHPFHLHGYSFAVLEMGVFEDGKRLNQVLREFRSKRLDQAHTPPLVDTLAVPTQGYAIIRFKADNPGYWMLHCHIQNHHETGMFTVVKVGNRSHLPPVPRGFPRCGNYLPKFTYN